MLQFITRQCTLTIWKTQDTCAINKVWYFTAIHPVITFAAPKKTTSDTKVGDRAWVQRTIMVIDIAMVVPDTRKKSRSSRTRGPQTFLSEGHISYYTTVRRLDITRNVIVSGYVTSYHINKLFVNMLLFHYWQNVFAGRIWPTGRSLEILN